MLDSTSNLTNTPGAGKSSSTTCVDLAYSFRSIFYAGYLAAQLPATYIMKRMPIGKFTSGTIICWAIVLALHAAVTNYEGLLACRFLLGL